MNQPSSVGQSLAASQPPVDIDTDDFIFCSLRFTPEVEKAAGKIIDALSNRGVKALKMDIQNGGKIAEKVTDSLGKSKLVLVFASPTWGERTPTDGCTADEWALTCAINKEYFLIRMAHSFKVLTTTTLFHNRLCPSWLPNAT